MNDPEDPVTVVTPWRYTPATLPWIVLSTRLVEPSEIGLLVAWELPTGIVSVPLRANEVVPVNVAPPVTFSPCPPGLDASTPTPVELLACPKTPVPPGAGWR